MCKRAIMMMVAVALIAGSAYAMCGSCGTHTATEKGASTPVKANNTVCPVSGDKVNMANPSTVEYGGTVYNLCCPACAEPFKADPAKYVAKAKAPAAQ